jgi:pimeloyl-ACP methyl ester carboxylesterase
MVFALTHASKVERLVLVDSFGAFGPGKRWERRSLLNAPRWALKYVQQEKAAKINIFFPLYSRMLGNWDGPKRQAVYLTVSPQMKYDYKNQSGRLILFREGQSGEFIENLATYKMEQITSDENRKEVHACHLALMETRRKDLIERLSEITVPVLIMRGNYDTIVLDGEARLMAAAIPHSTLITYPRSAHYPMIEESDNFNRDLIYFLTGKDPGIFAEKSLPNQ